MSSLIGDVVSTASCGLLIMLEIILWKQEYCPRSDWNPPANFVVKPVLPLLGRLIGERWLVAGGDCGHASQLDRKRHVTEGLSRTVSDEDLAKISGKYWCTSNLPICQSSETVH